MQKINFPAFFGRYIQQKEPLEKALQMGRFALVDNPFFTASFVASVAKKTGHFPDFESWKRFLNTTIQTPIKPDRENPALYKNPEYVGRDDLEARTYRAYIFNKKLEKYDVEHHKAQRLEARKRQIKNRYSVNEAGYIFYILDKLDQEQKSYFSSPQHFLLDESRRVQHTYISGGTGSGKSEMMKTIIHHYLTKNRESALVLIDPHGKIAQEVAHFRENEGNDRLVFIAPNFDPVQSPVFNPFDVGKGISPLTLDITVQELVGAFREILQDVGFTPQMETLLKPCIATLLLLPRANLWHLQQFMDKEQNGELVAFALENLPNPAQRHFLKTDFNKRAYEPSRQSIKTKIQSLLNSQIFLNFVMGKSSFSIERAIEEKKLIIFSLSRSTGAETSDTMGRLLLSRLQSIAMLRGSLDAEALKKAPAIHLFIDECQHYVTPSIETILTETRKYKLYLTLANQFIDQIENKRIKNAIKGNTALKITGRQTDTATLQTITKTTGANAEEIKNLSQGKFHIKAGELQSVIVQNTTALLDNSHAMKPHEWESLRKEQVKRYYRPPLQDSQFLQSHTEGETQRKKKAKKRGLN